MRKEPLMHYILRRLIFELGTGRALANARAASAEHDRTDLELDALEQRFVPEPVIAAA
jgi:hypothetical protein